MMGQGFTFIEQQVGCFDKVDLELTRQHDVAAALNGVQYFINAIGINLIR